MHDVSPGKNYDALIARESRASKQRLSAHIEASACIENFSKRSDFVI
jgi:hypothetical protein